MMDKLQLVRSMKSRKLAKHNIISGLGGLFSEDIMIDIFLWLPVKSLIRFKRLSKRWYFLITDRDNSYFRRNYLSTLSTRRRRRNRIVGRSDDDDDDDDSAIMAGFFSLKPFVYWKKSNEPVRFLPQTCTQFKKYSFLPPEGGKSSTTPTPTPTLTTTTEVISNINKINPFLSFEESLDKFFSERLHEDEESNPSIGRDRIIFVAASSNGFLLCTLCSGFSHSIDFLVNPVTMEWLALPPLEPVETIHTGFVCKGDYPSLDLVEYTIVRLSWLEVSVTLLFQLFSSASASGGGGDNEWSEYRVSCDSLPVKFDLWGQHDNMIVSTTTTTTNNQGGGSRRVLVYFLVTLWRTKTTAIVVVELNEGDDDQSLQVFETPGGPLERKRGVFPFCGADYIREFGDGRIIHFVRFSYLAEFEFWVLNTESGEWYLQHKTSLRTMLSSKVYDMVNVMKWTNVPYHIHGFHPMNPNLVFLTLYGKFACYNVKTGVFEVIYDFDAQNVKYNYFHFVYQWPCWPPLL